jgi:hypothetical protein
MAVRGPAVTRSRPHPLPAVRATLCLPNRTRGLGLGLLGSAGSASSAGSAGLRREESQEGSQFDRPVMRVAHSPKESAPASIASGGPRLASRRQSESARKGGELVSASGVLVGPAAVAGGGGRASSSFRRNGSSKPASFRRKESAARKAGGEEGAAAVTGSRRFKKPLRMSGKSSASGDGQPGTPVRLQPSARMRALHLLLHVRVRLFMCGLCQGALPRVQREHALGVASTALTLPCCAGPCVPLARAKT